MITLTVVRHGESTDNLRARWAGWTDSPLSNHGMNQAKALGKAFASTRIDAVLTSPLKRALWTGQQIQAVNHGQPSLTVSPLLREQYFGLAEGHPFSTDGKTGFFRQPGRVFKFPDGECLEDVRRRADEAVVELIEPILKESYGQSPDSKHVVIVAHGIFNFEFIGALLSRRPEGIDLHWSYRGMTNTGWTRLEVGYAVGFGLGDLLTGKGEVLNGEPFKDGYFSVARPMPLEVETVCWNVTSHLDGLRRQAGGIGSATFDEKQSSIRDFFGGAQND